MNSPGAFIISLDFELHWGLFDHTELNDRSRAYFDRTRSLIAPTLALFEKNGIQASWATVGMLFARNKAELIDCLPPQRPNYDNERLNPYRLLAAVGDDESADPYHYAPSLIKQINATPGQVIGSHTFSHYYCLESGQQQEDFVHDLASAQKIMNISGYLAASALVFPRNQYRSDYLLTLPSLGFNTYRSNPEVWFWKPRPGKDTSLLQRAARLGDNYLPIWGDTTFSACKRDGSALIEVPASRFLRPYVAKLDGYGGQQLKVRRILREMSHAARGGKNYHLWWHPHNLATHPEKNMTALKTIVKHYGNLNKAYGWQSHSMETYTEYCD